MYEGPERRRNSFDHDLIIEINSRVISLVEAFAEHRERDTKKFEDQEKRLRFLEKSVFVGLGAIALLEIALELFIK